MQEPVLANKCGYPVLVKTPTGNFVNVRPNAAVAGPGFAQYVQTGVLTRVNAEYKGGPVVYETPLTAKPAAPAPTPKVEPTVVEKAAPVEPKAGNSAEKAKASEEKVERAAQSGDKISVPDSGELNSMRKADLSSLAKLIGLDSGGTRSKLLSRLMPLAGKRVAKKK